MSNGPQLKSRRSLQPTDSKLAKLEAVTAWTEEPAQVQADALQAINASVRLKEASRLPTPQPASENVTTSRLWPGKNKKAVVATQMSFRLPVDLKARMEDALYRLKDGTTMTDVIVQGIEAQVVALEAYLDKQ